MDLPGWTSGEAADSTPQISGHALETTSFSSEKALRFLILYAHVRVF